MSPEEQRPWLALPPRDQRFGLAFLCGSFLLLWCVTFVGAEWISGLVPWRIQVDLAIERYFPFVPELVWLYLSLDVVLLLAPFVLRRVEQLATLFLALTLATAVATVVFVLLPVEPRFLAFDPPTGLLGSAFQLADAINLDRNLLPSLHVAFAVLAALALAPRGRPAVRLALGTWALGVAISTVLLRQHHLLDVLAGAALAVGAWVFVTRVAVPRGWARALAIDVFCIDTMLQFARRHRRYLTISLALLAASVPRWRERRLLRTGFCTLQAIDDLYDGDRPCADPIAVADALALQIHHRNFGDEPLALLARAMVEDLEARGGRDAVAQVAALIAHMRLDWLRRRDLLAFDQGALTKHHRTTFTLSLDLMLLAGDCELRAADVPELVDALGWCSTVRDLPEDLDHGLINLPREVVVSFAAEGARPDRSWADQPAARVWLEAGRIQALASIDGAEATLLTLRGRSGHSVLRRFARSIRRYAENPIVPGSTG